jgi:hypothetical protein
MNSLLKLKKIIDEHFDKLNELTNKKVNIIVLGGARSKEIEIIENDINTWNNPKQCEYSDMLKLKTNLEAKGYTISIHAVDSSYPISKIDIDIPHCKDSFKFDSTVYLKKNTHNIIVTFSNGILPNNNELYSYKNVDISNIKDYKITYIDCSGANKDNSSLWNTNFPTDVIENIIKYDLTTPIDKNDYNSYIYAINTTKQLKQNGIFEVMKPYILASWYILGNLMSNDNKKNDIIHKKLNEIYLKDNTQITNLTKIFGVEVMEKLKNVELNNITFYTLNIKTKQSFYKIVFRQKYFDENILRNVLKKINLKEICKDQDVYNNLKNFIDIDNDEVWNTLEEKTRQFFYKLVYGIEHKNGMNDFK